MKLHKECMNMQQKTYPTSAIGELGAGAELGAVGGQLGAGGELGIVGREVVADGGELGAVARAFSGAFSAPQWSSSPNVGSIDSLQWVPL